MTSANGLESHAHRLLGSRRIALAALAGRVPEHMNLAPALAIGRQPGGAQNALDVKPFERLIAVDALQIANEHGVIEAEPRAEFAQRRRALGNQQAQLDAQGRAEFLLQLLAVAFLPVLLHLRD